MAVGFAAVVILKKAVRSLPVVGSAAKPLLGAPSRALLWDGGVTAKPADCLQVASTSHTCTSAHASAQFSIAVSAIV